MNPRTVQMAKEVRSQLTSAQLEDYGNIILNGYAEVVPNTINKKRWQYKETVTAPVNLPGLVQVTPALKGWTTNYQEYYTQLQPNGYGVNPGDPTMFEYVVHSFTPQEGSITATGWINGGSGYTLGTYSGVALTGGSGTGATANLVVTPTPGVVGGPVTAVSLLNGGSGYSPFSLFNGPATTVTGAGSGLYLSGSANGFGAVTFVAIDPSFTGTGYQTGDIVAPLGGTARVQVTSVSVSGSVTGFTLVNPGTGYVAGEALSAVLPGGSGFSVIVSTINPDFGTGGEGKWAQAPRRLISNQVSAILYPVADNLTPPPIGSL